MIKRIKENKIVFVAVLLVLIGTLILSLALGCRTKSIIGKQEFVTAEDESNLIQQSSLESENTTPEPTIAPIPTPMSAETLAKINTLNQSRRSATLIPNMGLIGFQCKSWESYFPEESNSATEKAKSAAEAYAKLIFNLDVSGLTSTEYFRDSSGYRPDIVKLSMNAGSIVCTLKVEDYSLVNIDYSIIPQGEPKEAAQIANELATVLKGEFKLLSTMASTNSTATYGVELQDGRCFAFCTLYDELCAVSVLYPEQKAMWEMAHFAADIRHTESIIKREGPAADFVEGEPSDDDLSSNEAYGIFRTFIYLASGEIVEPKPQMVFYIDNSGARENYWHIENEQAAMDIASKSRNIIRWTCNEFFNPKQNDLSGIPYEKMGGQEYIDYVTQIAERLFGQDRIVLVSTNAVADSYYCTMFLELTDGTLYEFFFTSGKLTEVQYTFDKSLYGSVHGWMADNLFQNTITGEYFSVNDTI